MKSFVRLFFVALVVTALGSVEVSAQRQTPGRPSIDVYMNAGPISERPFFPAGGGINYVRYGYLTRFTGGLDVSLSPLSFIQHQDAVLDRDGNELAPEENNPYSFNSYDVLAGVGYHIRIYGTRNRVFILSAGGNFYLGARICEQLKSFTNPNKDDKQYPSVGYLMSIVPEFQAEVFPFRSVSLYLAFRPKMDILDVLSLQDYVKVNWFRPCAAFGTKIYF